MSELTAAMIGGLSLGAIYSLVTLGIVLIFRATETFNFAHGSFMLLGALIVGDLAPGDGIGVAMRHGGLPGRESHPARGPRPATGLGPASPHPTD